MRQKYKFLAWQAMSSTVYSNRAIFEIQHLTGILFRQCDDIFWG